MLSDKVWLNDRTNFFYLKRGIDRTPIGSSVEIVQCSRGIVTTDGTLKKTAAFGLKQSHCAQMIAFSLDQDDLMLFAMEYNWVLVGFAPNIAPEVIKVKAKSKSVDRLVDRMQKAVLDAKKYINK